MLRPVYKSKFSINYEIHVFITLSVLMNILTEASIKAFQWCSHAEKALLVLYEYNSNIIRQLKVSINDIRCPVELITLSKLFWIDLHSNCIMQKVNEIVFRYMFLVKIQSNHVSYR